MSVWVAAWLGLGCGVTSGESDQEPGVAASRAAEARRMVERQLRGRGIADERVLDAMTRVPRHRFVPAEQQAEAYADHALPIGYGQTISQPYVVAFMTEALKIAPTDVVLEIGTGSGYQAAVLAELAREVYTIEIVPELAERAARTLASLGYRNVHVRAGDGYAGWPSTRRSRRSSSPRRPRRCRRRWSTSWPSAASCAPVGRSGDQELRILTKTERGVVTERSLPVRFVPMVKPPPRP